MAVNAEVFQETQFGVQSVAGTGVPADKLLSSTGIDVRPQGESQVFAPAGSKFDTLVAPNKLWTTGAITGIPCYTELQYLLSTLFDNGGGPSVAGGVGTWTFISNQREPDDIVMLTIERGSNVAGEATRFIDGVARSLSLVFDRNAGISQGGEFMGRAIERGITLTDSPTGLALVPVLAKDVNVYLDRTSAADLGSTQLPDTFHVEFACANKLGQKWSLDRANGLSYAAPVELKPTITSRFTHEANTAGLDLLDDFENGATAWLRIEAISSVLIPATATPFSLIIDMAVSVERPEGFRDEGGVHAIEFALRGLFDGVWGNAFRIVLVNGETSL